MPRTEERPEPSQNLKKVTADTDWKGFSDEELQELFVEVDNRCNFQEGVCRRVVSRGGDINTAVAELKMEIVRFNLIDEEMKRRGVKPPGEWYCRV